MCVTRLIFPIVHLGTLMATFYIRNYPLRMGEYAQRFACFHITQLGHRLTETSLLPGNAQHRRRKTSKYLPTTILHVWTVDT